MEKRPEVCMFLPLYQTGLRTYPPACKGCYESESDRQACTMRAMVVKWTWISQHPVKSQRRVNSDQIKALVTTDHTPPIPKRWEISDVLNNAKRVDKDKVKRILAHRVVTLSQNAEGTGMSDEHVSPINRWLSVGKDSSTHTTHTA